MLEAGMGFPVSIEASHRRSAPVAALPRSGKVRLDLPEEADDASRRSSTDDSDESDHEAWRGSLARPPSVELAEARRLASRWARAAHPRALQYYSCPEKLEEILGVIASNITKGDDPVLGPPSRCVLWQGDVVPEEEGPEHVQQAVLQIRKPGKECMSLCYVNRLLSFMFVDDDSLRILTALPKVPFAMACGNQLCVCVQHVGLNV